MLIQLLEFDIMVDLMHIQAFQLKSLEPMHWSWFLTMNPIFYEIEEKPKINDVFMNLCIIYEKDFFMI